MPVRTCWVGHIFLQDDRPNDFISALYKEAEGETKPDLDDLGQARVSGSNLEIVNVESASIGLSYVCCIYWAVLVTSGIGERAHGLTCPSLSADAPPTSNVFALSACSVASRFCLMGALAHTCSSS